jgi:hypothetical protein
MQRDDAVRRAAAADACAGDVAGCDRGKTDDSDVDDVCNDGAVVNK